MWDERISHSLNHGGLCRAVPGFARVCYVEDSRKILCLILNHIQLEPTHQKKNSEFNFYLGIKYRTSWIRLHGYIQAGLAFLGVVLSLPVYQKSTQTLGQAMRPTGYYDVRLVDVFQVDFAPYFISADKCALLTMFRKLVLPRCLCRLNKMSTKRS